MSPRTTLLVIGANEEKRKAKLGQILSEIFPKAAKFNPNLVRIVGQIGIEQVRNFKLTLSQKPYLGDVQVGLAEIEDITTEAQNALLKLIEEPSESTQIIISIDNAAKLLATVISRCNKIFVSDWLEAPNLQSATKDAKILLFGDIGEKFSLAEKITKDRVEEWIAAQIFFWRKVILTQFEVERANLPEIINITKIVEVKRTFKLLKTLLRTQTLLKLNINQRLLLENLFLST